MLGNTVNHSQRNEDIVIFPAADLDSKKTVGTAYRLGRSSCPKWNVVLVVLTVKVDVLTITPGNMSAIL